MDHKDHVDLLRPANLGQGGIWADFGAGSGAFTLALSELVGLKAEIYAIDKDSSGFGKLEQAHRARFGTSQNIHPFRVDFTGPLSLPPLDGVLMANSLHYVKDKPGFIQKVTTHLNTQGCFLLVEYDTNIPNSWVPYPQSFSSLQKLFSRFGFSTVLKLNEQPSIYNRSMMYAAVIKR